MRQYIGARYVPKFMGTYNATTNYEALCVVDNGAGTSYIATRPTPAGTPLTDNTYWALYGSANGAIINLQDQINVLNNEVFGEYIVWIGDSFVGAGSLPDAQRSNRFSTRVSNMLGLIEKNYAVGGTGYVTSSPTFHTQVLNAITDFNNNNLDKSKVKYVVIAGGGNDGYISPSDMSSFVTEAKNTYYEVIANFTNAKLIVIPYLWKAQYLPQNFLEAISYLHTAAVETLGDITFVEDAYRWMIGRYDHILYQSGAMVHPDVYGHAIFARHVYSAIMGQPWSIPSYFVLPVTFNSNLDTDHCNAVLYNDGKYQHLRVIITGGASDYTFGSVYEMSRPDFNAMRSMFIGEQVIYCSPTPRDGDSSIDVFPKCYLESHVTMTDDGTGSWTCALKLYNGAIKAGKKYMLDLTIPFGISYGTYNY